MKLIEVIDICNIVNIN